MKIVFVTPRYGEEIIGGAEAAARMLAENLVETLKWDVEVFTTCALDYVTWNNDLPADETIINGVLVRRFASTAGRSQGFYALDGLLRTDPTSATLDQARKWVQLNGPVCPALVEAISRSDADAFAFYPYLYYSTVEGIRAAPGPSILHPAAHDEPALYLEVFRDTFSRADAIAYHTPAERHLVQGVFPVAQKRQISLGLGIPKPTGQRRTGGDILGIGGRPYLASVGRVDEMKGAIALAEFFKAFKELYPGPLAMALVGPVVADIPDHPDIIMTGQVDESDKWDIVRDAQVAVSPSAYESFSLVTLEAWRVGVPVLVNGLCEVTRQHCEASGGGLWFDSFRSFAKVLRFMLTHPDECKKLGDFGRQYVEDRYEWPNIIRRYGTFVETVVANGRGA